MAGRVVKGRVGARRRCWGYHEGCACRRCDRLDHLQWAEALLLMDKCELDWLTDVLGDDVFTPIRDALDDFLRGRQQAGV